MRPRFVLYSRLYCHLCEDMLLALRRLQATHAFELDIEDIDEEPGLRQAYDTLVPVLTYRGEEVCRYHLDTSRLLRILDRSGAHP